MTLLTREQVLSCYINPNQYERLPQYVQSALFRVYNERESLRREVDTLRDNAPTQIAYRTSQEAGRRHERAYVPAREVEVYPYAEGEQPHWHGSRRPYIEVRPLPFIGRVRIYGSESFGLHPTAGNVLDIELTRY